MKILRSRAIPALFGLVLVTSACSAGGASDQGEATTTTYVVNPTSTATPPTTTSTTLPTVSSTIPSSTTSTTGSTTTSTSIAPPTSTSIPTPTSIPAFSIAVSTPTASQLSSSWSPGCPVAVEDLRLLAISHWGYDGKVRVGQLVVAQTHVGATSAVFETLYAERFPIERMELVDNYGGDDNASMAANNTSAFNCRKVTGGSSYSEHSYGRAIDINPLVNPYVKGSTVLPPGGAAYVDRSLDAPGMIHSGDEVVKAFATQGWVWGGTWSSLKDYQHFSSTGN